MTFYGYTPYEHQWAVHKAMAGYYKSGRMFVVKSKRQVGKTTMAENILLECAIKHPSTLSVLVEPTLDQCRRVYKEMVRAIEDTPILRRKNDSLLEIELVTGRTHQIRAHMSYIGHPLLGDGKYGINKNDRAKGYKYQIKLDIEYLCL